MCLNRPKGLPPPENLVDISATDISRLLLDQFKRAYIFMSDSTYKTTSIDELMRFIKSDPTNEYRYISEYHDCDDFSFQLMGSIHSVEWGALPFGITWLNKPSGNHAMNIFIDKDHEIYLIEPQNDIIQVCPSNWVPYLVII
jgi:hypothetical protein